MKKAFRLLLCVSLFALIVVSVGLRALAQVKTDNFTRQATADALQMPQLPQVRTERFRSLLFPTFRPYVLPPPVIFAGDTAWMLQNAIEKRLGIRYRFFGVDDRGYDCSGFVWRVFQDAGASFERVAARTLWQQLPEATEEEAKQFGTLVFFNGLKHVGIVRDAFSFYHASRSQGVTLSSLAGYWGTRITGYRRAPVPVTADFLKLTE